MKYFILLNEFTLVRAVVLILLRKHVYLIPSETSFMNSWTIFSQIVRWMKSFSNVREIFDIMPETKKYWDILFYHNRTNIFAQTEAMINRRFKFHSIEESIGDYSYSFKHATCKYMADLFNQVFLIKDISDNFDSNEATFVHANEDILFIYETYFGSRPRFRCMTPIKINPVVNIISLVAILMYIIKWSLGIVTFRYKVPTPIFMGADFTGAEKQVEMVKNIVGDPRDCLFVFRNLAQRQGFKGDLGNFSRCLASDGEIPAAKYPNFMLMTIRDGFRIYRKLGWLAPEHFILVVKLVQKRASYIALLNRYNFRYFWCRDDYNSEHIIRSQELRKVGTISLGINHGLTSPLLIHPILRYIDYDIYYVFGEHLYKTYYMDTWSKGMKVKPVGSLCMTKEYLQRIDIPRPKDIIYFVTPGVNEEEMHQAVMTIANAFPEKKIYAKIKSTERNRGFYEEFINFCKIGPENLFETEEDSYDLMFKASYAVSGRSTITAEAIQFGLKVFSFDFAGPEFPYYYRDFEGLCVRSAEETIDRIRAIESGLETYPVENFKGLIDLSRNYLIDVIRGDLDFLPKNL